MRKAISPHIKNCIGYAIKYYHQYKQQCDNCVAGSRYNAKNNTYTSIRCTIQADIFTQYLGKGNDAIRQKSYDATQHNDCPYIVPLGTPRPKRYKVTLEQQTLFEE